MLLIQVNVVVVGQDAGNCSSSQVGDFVQTLNPTQYQHLLSMLSSFRVSKMKIEPDPPQEQALGSCFSISVSPMLNDPRY